MTTLTKTKIQLLLATIDEVVRCDGTYKEKAALIMAEAKAESDADNLTEFTSWFEDAVEFDFPKIQS